MWQLWCAAEKLHRRQHSRMLDPPDDSSLAGAAPTAMRPSAANSLLSAPSCSTVATGATASTVTPMFGHGPAHAGAAWDGSPSTAAQPQLPSMPAGRGAHVREERPNAAVAARVAVEPRAHHYKSVVFAPTTLCVSLRVDNMKFAKCHDKVIRVPDYRYEDMHGARPAALLSRCDLLWPCLLVAGSAGVNMHVCSRVRVASGAGSHVAAW